jgi:hypothetical protein
MTTYQLKGPSRVCWATQRPLEVGEPFYSAVLEVDGRFERRDYSATGWAQPPEGAVAWWKSRVPLEVEAKPAAINDELLVDCFEHLSGARETDRLNFRYVVALLLMRRKRFRFEDVRKVGEQESLIIRDVRTGKKHDVVDPRLDDAAMAAVQDEVFRILGWE